MKKFGILAVLFCLVMAGPCWAGPPTAPSSGVLEITSAHTFSDNTARDAYFVAHASEKKKGLNIIVGTGVQNWNGSTWTSVTPVYKGPKGDTGAAGAKGDTGSAGPTGSTGPQGPAGQNGTGAGDLLANGSVPMTGTLFGKTIAAKGPIAITSFAGTISSTTGSGSTYGTIIFSSAADAILAGYSATNPVLGAQVTANSWTVTIIGWTNSTTAKIGDSPERYPPSYANWSGTTITSVQLPKESLVNSDGTLSTTHLADGSVKDYGTTRGDGTPYLSMRSKTNPGFSTNGFMWINGDTGDPVPAMNASGMDPTMLGIKSDVDGPSMTIHYRSGQQYIRGLASGSGTVSLWDIGEDGAWESPFVKLGKGSTTLGQVVLYNNVNNNPFTIFPGATGVSVGWRTPIAMPAGNNYTLVVDTDGTMHYLPPVTSVDLSSPGTIGGTTPGSGNFSSVNIGTTGLSTVNNVLTLDKPIKTTAADGSRKLVLDNNTSATPATGETGIANIGNVLYGFNNGGTPFPIPTSGGGGITVSTSLPTSSSQAYINGSTGVLTVGVAAGYYTFAPTSGPTAYDSTPPTLSSITIGTNGTSWTYAYSEAVQCLTTGNCCTPWTVSMTTAGAITQSYASGSGTSSIVCTGSPTVNSGDTKASGATFTQTGNLIEDLAGNDLATVTNHAVTNNSTQGSAKTFTPGTPCHALSNSVACTVAAGDLVIVDYYWSTSDNTNATISDGTSSLTMKTRRFNGGAGSSVQAGYILSSVASGTITYTASVSGSPSTSRITVYPFTPSSPAIYDTEAGGTGYGTAVTTPAFNTAGTHGLAVAYVNMEGGAASAEGIGGSAAEVVNCANVYECQYYNHFTSPQTGITAVATQAITSGWAIDVQVFK